MEQLSAIKRNEIEKEVSALLKRAGYKPDKDDYVDIINFVRQYGFYVGNANLDESDDGFILIRDDKPSKISRLIGVNARRSLELKRFVVAHEFAHSILHYDGGQIFLHRENKKGRSQEENDADYFAASLLMPRESFHRLYDQLSVEGLRKNAIYMQLASIYKVPLQSVVRRVAEVEG